MLRTSLWAGVAAAALGSGTAASPAAAATLRAIGDSAASAGNQFDGGGSVLMPAPDSLTITETAEATDGLVNPTPPPDSWSAQCLVGGSGVARYGALAGLARAEARSRPANTVLPAGGEVSLNLGFTDGAEVVSDSLDDGTPVTLTFVMTLEATAVHFTLEGLADPDGTGAAARHEVEVRDLDNLVQAPGEGALVVNSRGASEGLRSFELDTAVGHRIEILADLFVAAGVDASYATTGVSEGTAEVLAGQTAELFHEPSGDVRLVSDSGHDYAAPEPGQPTLLALGAAVLALGGRRCRLR
jgi:hypothetical protein